MKLKKIHIHAFRRKYTRQIIATDGTYPTLLRSLTKDNFKSNKNNQSVTPLITGLFNVTTNYPIIMELAKTKDERKEFLNFISNKEQFKNNIFVFDKGYDGDLFFDTIEQKELMFICRIKDNRKYISNENDKIVHTSRGQRIPRKSKIF